jgi:UDP-N-acetylmuramoyl-L-alanyl-D-glutamate--2,6-diaminopimelate ligase
MTLGTLMRLVGGTPAAGAAGSLDAAAEAVAVSAIEHDSRQVAPGALFVAIKGLHADGLGFVEAAMAKGAAAVVAERPAPVGWPTPWVVVPDARATLAHLAAAFYGHPSRELRTVGITGTNGKTTTSYLVAAVCDAAGLSCGRLGTVGYRVGADERPALHTTPEANVVQRLLREMVTRGNTACAMEVSSHALVLERVTAVEFAAAAFTNLTRDHLDFHGDMESYFQAKRRLFDMLPPGAPAVVNVDDPAGRRIADRPGTIAYGLTTSADVTCDEVTPSLQGVTCTIRSPRGRTRVTSALPGRPNVYNLLAAFGVGLALDLPTEAIVDGLARITTVPGRFQVASDAADDIVCLVDYAHTDDALRNLLETVRPLARGRLVVVFGCGGDRDRTKRPLMGAVAGRLADLVVITSDNPRSEDPAAIIEDITRGLAPPPDRTPGAGSAEGAGRFNGARWTAVPDRRQAIERAVLEARPGDVVIVAGKGHETYQIVGQQVLPFDDVAVVRDVLAARRARMKVS